MRVSIYTIATFSGLLFTSGVFGSDINGNYKVQSSWLNCTIKDFPQFVQQFAMNIPIQKLSIAFPLKKIALVSGDPAAKLDTLYLTREELHFPVMPNPQEIYVKKLFRVIENTPDGNWKVTFKSPDSTYNVAYTFRPNPCWLLIEIEDLSL